jgi:hypothetical protein
METLTLAAMSLSSTIFSARELGINLSVDSSREMVLFAVFVVFLVSLVFLAFVIISFFMGTVQPVPAVQESQAKAGDSQEIRSSRRLITTS